MPNSLFVKSWEKLGVDEADVDGEEEDEEEDEERDKPDGAELDDAEGEEDDDENDDAESKDDSDEEIEEEPDQEVKFLESRRRHEEDEEFENAFKAVIKVNKNTQTHPLFTHDVTQESLETNRTRQVNTDNMAIPAVIPTAKSDATSFSSGPAVAFRVLRRDVRVRDARHEASPYTYHTMPYLHT